MSLSSAISRDAIASLSITPRSSLASNSNKDVTASLSSLITARSSSISMSPTNSSGDDYDDGSSAIEKTPPHSRSKKHEHGGAGDNIGRTSRQVPTTSTYRRGYQGAAPWSERHSGGTPQARPKHPFGRNGMGGGYMPPRSYPPPRPDDLFLFDDLDVLLYTVKELCALVESERFVCGSRFMAQFQILTQRILFVSRKLSQRSRQQAYTQSIINSTIYDSFLRHRSSPDDFSRHQSHELSSQSDEDQLPSGERVLKHAKVMIPECPNYNFIGRILGPRGISVRQLEASTGCGIVIRGKGSVKDADREERLRSKNTPGFEHLKEPLHVLITAEGNDEAECDTKLEKCKRRIEKLLKPEYDEYKRHQLAQLAMINGNYDASRGLPI